MINILNIFLGFLWYLLHLLINVVNLYNFITQMVNSLLNSHKNQMQYKDLKVENIKHLAIVVDSEEAKDSKAIMQLLLWLRRAKIKYVILYDMDGILKKTIGVDMHKNILKKDTNKSLGACLVHMEDMTIEILSSRDNKEGIAKAANFLCSKYFKDDGSLIHNIEEPTFTESDIVLAMEAVGNDGPEPELLLIYGPARCHLGFPAWRLIYTEMVHMGSLKSMTYEDILKTFTEYLTKHQNYGK